MNFSANYAGDPAQTDKSHNLPGELWPLLTFDSENYYFLFESRYFAVL